MGHWEAQAKLLSKQLACLERHETRCSLVGLNRVALCLLSMHAGAASLECNPPLKQWALQLAVEVPCHVSAK